MYLFASEVSLSAWLNAHEGVRTFLVAAIIVTMLVSGFIPERRARTEVYRPERRGGAWGGKSVKVGEPSS